MGCSSDRNKLSSSDKFANSQYDIRDQSFLKSKIFELFKKYSIDYLNLIIYDSICFCKEINSLNFFIKSYTKFFFKFKKNKMNFTVDINFRKEISDIFILHPYLTIYDYLFDNLEDENRICFNNLKYLNEDNNDNIEYDNESGRDTIHSHLSEIHFNNKYTIFIFFNPNHHSFIENKFCINELMINNLKNLLNFKNNSIEIIPIFYTKCDNNLEKLKSEINNFNIDNKNFMYTDKNSFNYFSKKFGNKNNFCLIYNKKEFIEKIKLKYFSKEYMDRLITDSKNKLTYSNYSDFNNKINKKIKDTIEIDEKLFLLIKYSKSEVYDDNKNLIEISINPAKIITNKENKFVQEINKLEESFSIMTIFSEIKFNLIIDNIKSVFTKNNLEINYELVIEIENKFSLFYNSLTKNRQIILNIKNTILDKKIETELELNINSILSKIGLHNFKILYDQDSNNIMNKSDFKLKKDAFKSIINFIKTFPYYKFENNLNIISDNSRNYFSYFRNKNIFNQPLLQLNYNKIYSNIETYPQYTINKINISFVNNNEEIIEIFKHIFHPVNILFELQNPPNYVLSNIKINEMKYCKKCHKNFYTNYINKINNYFYCSVTKNYFCLSCQDEMNNLENKKYYPFNLIYLKYKNKEVLNQIIEINYNKYKMRKEINKLKFDNLKCKICDIKISNENESSKSQYIYLILNSLNIDDEMIICNSCFELINDNLKCEKYYKNIHTKLKEIFLDIENLVLRKIIYND